MIKYHKLVRDRIPEIIRQHGKTPITRVADTEEYRVALRTKVIEEAKDLHVADDAHVVEEIADVFEVLRAIASVHGIPWEQIEAGTIAKNEHRGGFHDRIILEQVEE